MINLSQYSTLLVKQKLKLYTLMGLSFMAGCSEVTQHNVEPETKQPVPTTSNHKQNVVFILVDDLGYSDIAAYNQDSFYETPHIDQLATEGVQFTNGYAANPVCSPSRYAVLTGQHPTRFDATDWFHVNNWPHRSEKFNPAPLNQYLPHEDLTLAEAFKEQGYQTAFLGKWHLGEEKQYWPEQQGFDVNIGGVGHGMPPNGYFSPYKNPRLTDGPEGEYLTHRLTSEAVNLIDGYAKNDQPFFLYMSFYTVHTPLQAPAETIEKYQKKRANLDTSHSFTDEEQIWPSDEERQVRIKQNHAIYAAMIEEMDKNIGQILQKLKETGLDQNTIVVFTSDNGGLSTAEGSPTSNLPLRGGKGWLYEGGIRVPFIIKVPNAKANGSVVDVPVVSTDFYPTLLTAAGLEPKPDQHKDGVELSPLLTASGAIKERAIYFHYPHYSNQGGFPGAAIRVGDWKLLERFEDGQVQLYNLAQDIGEQNDLSETMPQKVSELRQQLHNWYKETDAKFLTPKNSKSPWVPEI